VNLDQIKKVIADIEEEIPIIRTTVENVILKGDIPSPMLVFYNSTSERGLVVAPSSDEDTFLSRMRSVADTLHLYRSMEAAAVTVTFASKIELDNTLYELLNIFVMNDDYAFSIRLPFIINEDQSVNWFTQLDEATPVDEIELDDTGRDMVSMFYHYTHADKIGFSPSDILSYLACKGAAIEQINTKYEYVQYSSEADSNDQNPTPEFQAT
jgi:hypothetical protein